MGYKISAQPVTFITGNQNKADYLQKYLGYPVNHQKVDLNEIQSLDLREIVKHKAKDAYGIVNSPVLVEDVALEFEALGRLPGAFIRHYVDEVSLGTICKTLDGLNNRNATAKCVFGYYDGAKCTFFENNLTGTIAKSPHGEGGYGWDKIFIPRGYNVTRAEMNEAQYKETYLQIKPFAKLKKFLKDTN